jgi:glutamate synthase domain-containing protein 3
MSGGIAYVLAPDREIFAGNCNLDMVGLEDVSAGNDIAELLELLRQHHQLTHSNVARELIDDWDRVLGTFVKVMPLDYKRVLAERQAHDETREATAHNQRAACQTSN